MGVLKNKVWQMKYFWIFGLSVDKWRKLPENVGVGQGLPIAQVLRRLVHPKTRGRD
jgi:hypothetical protein